MSLPGNYDEWKTTEPDYEPCSCGDEDCDGDHSFDYEVAKFEDMDLDQ